MNYSFLLSFLKNYHEVFASLLAMRNTDIHENIYHLKLAGDWLLKAQSVNDDGGYSHSYSIYNGWGKSYPETTGYIIPTMLNLGEYLNNEQYISSAIKSGNWLLKIQQSDGSFPDISGYKQIFDTGQIIEGLISLYNKAGKGEFLDLAVKAGDFLVENQDSDGKWAKLSYNNIPHTYYSRVAANLLKLHVITGEHKYKASAEKNLLWITRQQNDNGYFKFMSFLPDELPYLHTIIYVLEGLLDCYKVLKSEELFACLKKTVAKLVSINKERDFILYSQYDENWRFPRKEKCLTGLAQWADLLLRLYMLTKEEEYFKQAVKTIYYLKSKQIQGGSENILGAIPGSIPIWGSYFRFSFNNWTIKFFIDALLNLAQTDILERRM